MVLCCIPWLSGLNSTTFNISTIFNRCWTQKDVDLLMLPNWHWPFHLSIASIQTTSTQNTLLFGIRPYCCRIFAPYAIEAHDRSSATTVIQVFFLLIWHEVRLCMHEHLCAYVSLCVVAVDYLAIQPQWNHVDSTHSALFCFLSYLYLVNV